MTDPYVARLATQLLDLITELRIPCPDHPQGHHADLIVRRRQDGHADGWAVLDNDHTHTWTGLHWAPIPALSSTDIYRYRDIHTARAEAQRIAPLETQAFHNQIRTLYRQHERQRTP